MVTRRHLTEPVRGPGHFRNLFPRRLDDEQHDVRTAVDPARDHSRRQSFALVAASTLAPTIAAATNANGTVGVGAKALVGTWRVTVTTFPCANPQAKNPPFVSLLTFWL